MVFTNFGKVYKLLVDSIPVGTNTSTGVPINSLIELDNNEKAEVIYSLNRENTAKYILFATKQGIIKKVPLEDFSGMKRRSGVQAIKFREGDSLIAVTLIDNEELLLVTTNGQVIRINSDFGASGRAAIGIKGMTLKDTDCLVAVLPIRNSNEDLAVFFDKGQGKRIKLSEFNTQARGGKGLKIGKTGNNVTCACLIEENDSLLATGNTNSICISAKDVPLMSRTAVGSTIINGDIVISVSKI